MESDDRGKAGDWTEGRARATGLRIPSRRKRRTVSRPSGEGRSRRAGDWMTRRPESLPVEVDSPEAVALSVGRRRLTDRVCRVMDLVIASVALVLLSPLLLAIAVAIRLDSPGPILFRQLRVGLDRREGWSDDGGRRTDDLGGRPFFIYKFRTMHVDAEEGTGPVWASQEDGRVTRVGRVLRRLHLDEIPQFWNVVKGEMSVVGPRPERPSFVKLLERRIPGYKLRHKIRPGITGWAQLQQDGDSSLEDVERKVYYDLAYLKRHSPLLDLAIILRTPMVIFGRRKDGFGDGAFT